MIVSVRSITSTSSLITSSSSRSSSSSRLLSLLLPLLAVVSVVHATRDENTYGSYNNPNLVYNHYWEDAPNVLQDLTTFQALYVMYHGCAWSARYGEEHKEEEHHGRRHGRRRLPGEDEHGRNNNEGQCGQAGGEGDGNWYRGMGECYGSNAAYSLFGVLKTDKTMGRSPCSRKTFINSFYTTDGLKTFAPAGGVDVSSISQTCTSENNGESSITLGCSSNAKFQVDEFTGNGCIGTNYEATLDPLDTLNSALSNNMQCKLIYKSDGSVNYATQILSNSMACTTEGNQKTFCPDPFGMLSAYQYNFVMAQQNSNYTVLLASGKEGHPKARKTLGVILLLAGGFMLALAIQKWKRTYQANRAALPELMSSTDYVMS